MLIFPWRLSYRVKKWRFRFFGGNSKIQNLSTNVDRPKLVNLTNNDQDFLLFLNIRSLGFANFYMKPSPLFCTWRKYCLPIITPFSGPLFQHFLKWFQLSCLHFWNKKYCFCLLANWSFTLGVASVRTSVCLFICPSHYFSGAAPVHPFDELSDF